LKSRRSQRAEAISGGVTHPDQSMIVGVEPVQLGERLRWAANEPMRPAKVQRPLDIGFWDPMRNQLELF
jgi:hypothetical protein